MSDLRPELLRFDPRPEVRGAKTPPGSWYRLPSFLKLEERALFHRAWFPVARVDQLSRTGSFVAGRLSDLPYVVTRTEAGELAAFHNVCRHHATEVATPPELGGSGEGCIAALVCPYHGWTYGLDGRLQKAPRLGVIDDFDRNAYGLVPMHVHAHGPFVFVSAASTPPPFEPVEAALATVPMEGLRFVARRRYTLACNWKVYVDNYLDGGYHVPHLHGALASDLDLDSYTTEVSGDHVLQTCAAKNTSDRVAGRAIYTWLYPNFMLNRYGPVLDTNLVLPRGPSETEVVFDYYFDTRSGDDGEAFIARCLEESEQVQIEDTSICESVQYGLGSPAYDQGRYSSTHEAGMHHFHRKLHTDLLSSCD